MNLKEIQKRLKEINEELTRDGADVEKLEKEVNELIAKRDALLDGEQKRQALLEKLATGENDIVVRTFDNKKEMPEVKGADSEEYRSAFFKNMLGLDMTKEERAAFTHTTANTGMVVPKETLNKIFSNMEEQHPILKDVNILRTGTIITIVKHTAIAAGDAKEVAEGAATDDEQNTFKEVTIAGKDIAKSVKYSYRLKQMAIPAFEAYLIKEIGDRISSVWAKNVITQIKNDLAAENKITEAGKALKIDNILKALAALKGTNGQVYIYANSAAIYGQIATMKDADTKVSFIPDFSKGIAGTVLGKAVKQEDALGDKEILILDPSQYTENVAQDLLIESDRDIEKHVHIISGIVITGGTMTNDKGGALITITQ